MADGSRKRGAGHHPVPFFVLGGLALFGLDVWWPASGPPAPAAVETARREPIVITAQRVARLREEYTRETGLVATDDDENALVARAVEEEVLLREALARGLHRHDKSIRYRLVQKMEFLAEDEGVDDETLYRQALELDLGREDLVVHRLLIHKMRLLLMLAADIGEPTEEDLEAYLQANRERYVQPPRVSLSHVFLSAEKRGDDVRADAVRLLIALRAGAVAGRDGPRRGDVFPMGQEFPDVSRIELEKAFGSDFAAAVFGLEPRRWSGPLHSGHGLHLVWIEEVRPPVLPPLDAVRSQVTTALETARREAKLREELERLRRTYEVRFERAAAEERDAS
jgi:parvulin-like peptidyl-prolyl isomerase